MMENKRLEDVVFFSLDQTVKLVKQYSQKRFDQNHIDITIDQWVLMKIIEENKEISQVDLSALAIKDTASITRMIDILEKKKLVMRKDHESDRRKYVLALTRDGEKFIRENMPLVNELRKQGVRGITKSELDVLKAVLQKIAKNMS